MRTRVFPAYTYTIEFTHKTTRFVSLPWSGMAENEYCVGCGESVRDDRHRRLLLSDATSHVIPLWTHIVHLEGKVTEGRAKKLVKAGARMCRKCFTAYERCTKLMSVLQKSIANVVSSMQGDSSESDESDDHCEPPTQPPPPKRLAISAGPSNASPDVTVNTAL